MAKKPSYLKAKSPQNRRRRFANYQLRFLLAHENDYMLKEQRHHAARSSTAFGKASGEHSQEQATLSARLN